MLAAQGFLEPVGKRGFVVASFGEREIFEALDLRATLEGWAARKIAEEGASDELLSKLDKCLAEGDQLFARGAVSLEDESRYGRMNQRFHSLFIDACNSTVLSAFMERLEHVPFVAPSVIVFDQIGLRSAYDMLHRAHGFHHSIVDAIRAGDGARAEFLFREHANHQRASMFARRKAMKEKEAKG